ncbi:glycosyltransferase [Agarivorans sp. MS3-6]
MKPLISVAVSCYQFEDYIEQCLRSVLDQTCSVPFEVIVVDDCSKDNSRNIIEKLCCEYPNKLTAILSDTNYGSDTTKQIAISNCSGDFIAFLDGDDFAYPEKLETQYQYLQDNTDCVLCYHDMALVDANSQSLGNSFAEQFYNQHLVPSKAAMQHLVELGSFLVSSSQMFVNSRVHPCVLPADVKIIQDFYYHIHNSQYGFLGRIDKVLGAYRQHSASYTGLTHNNSARRWQTLADILYACDYAQNLGLDSESVRKGKSHYYFAASIYFLKRRAYSDFQKALEMSQSYSSPFNEKHKRLLELIDQPQAAYAFITSES